MTKVNRMGPVDTQTSLDLFEYLKKCQFKPPRFFSQMNWSADSFKPKYYDKEYRSRFMFCNSLMSYCKQVLYAKYSTAFLHDQSVS